MHDLQTIQFLNSDEQLAKRRAERQAAERLPDAGDLHDTLLAVLWDLVHAEGDYERTLLYRRGTKALDALHTLATQGGAK